MSDNVGLVLEAYSFLLHVVARPRVAKRQRLNTAVAPQDSSTEGSASTSVSNPTLPTGLASLDLLAEADSGVGADMWEDVPQPNSKPQFEFRLATAGAWNVLLPRLVYPLMEAEYQRRQPAEASPPTEAECSCVKRVAKVLVVSFTSMSLSKALMCVRQC